jgi:hypothetical protein
MNLAREIETAKRAAFKAYDRHTEACPLCTSIGVENRVDRCALGRILAHAYHELDQLRDQPSQWTTIEIEQWSVNLVANYLAPLPAPSPEARR